MRIFYPPPENIERGGRAIRKRILECFYAIHGHADQRMLERGITQADVIKCIKSGKIAGPSQREKRDGYFCVVFYLGPLHNELIVPVRAIYGDHSAKPIIVTAFRNSDFVPDSEFDDRVEYIAIEKPIVKAPDEMTIEELRSVLKRREDAESEKMMREAEARISVAQSHRAKLLQDRNRIDKEIAALDVELGKLARAVAREVRS